MSATRDMCTTVRAGRHWVRVTLVLGVCLLGVFLASLPASPVPARAASEAPPQASRSWTPGRPLSLAFPRLGMLYPDPSKQTLRRIARYDYVVLDWGHDAVTRLRRYNPDIILLVGSNACELAYDPNGSPTDNSNVCAVPPQWFLTQAGSTLAGPVDANVTDIRVETVSAPSSVRLFVAGDAIIVDGEIMKVLSVDTATGTLEVKRGFIRPAEPHAAGARVAALITFWPNSWMMNLSTDCPSVTVDPAVGPETWAEYNARICARRLGDEAWDGIYVDRADGNESWLLHYSTARTIDAASSNAVVTDYSAFDAAWNAGLCGYESRLRSLIGANRIIYVNGGYPNFDKLNGSNFEGFPTTKGTYSGTTWRGAVFGHSDAGSYLDWVKNSGQPNLTTVLTYQDDSGQSATGDGSYDNPATHEGFRPNYRKMRFGLCTALLGDGFFSFEINTNGLGALGLLWFDEYDKAGKQRGYLGRPLGPARPAIGRLSTSNLATGGQFESARDLAAWNLEADPGQGYQATATLDQTVRHAGVASVRLDVTASDGTDWQVKFRHTPVSLHRSDDYTLSFWACADRARPLRLWAQQSGAPWDVGLYLGNVNLRTTWRRYELGATCAGTGAGAQLVFPVGQSVGTVWLDDVRLQRDTRVWRRDFSRGVVLVNAGAYKCRVPLHGTFRKIRGLQCPTVNSGKLVKAVTLPPRSGIILLRR